MLFMNVRLFISFRLSRATEVEPATQIAVD